MGVIERKKKNEQTKKTDTQPSTGTQPKSVDFQREAVPTAPASQGKNEKSSDSKSEKEETNIPSAEISNLEKQNDSKNDDKMETDPEKTGNQNEDKMEITPVNTQLTTAKITDKEGNMNMKAETEKVPIETDKGNSEAEQNKKDPIVDKDKISEISVKVEKEQEPVPKPIQLPVLPVNLPIKLPTPVVPSSVSTENQDDKSHQLKNTENSTKEKETVDLKKENMETSDNNDKNGSKTPTRDEQEDKKNIKEENKIPDIKTEPSSQTENKIPSTSEAPLPSTSLSNNESQNSTKPSGITNPIVTNSALAKPQIEEKKDEPRVKWYDIALTKSTKHEIKSYFVEAETRDPEIDQQEYIFLDNNKIWRKQALGMLIYILS